MTKKQTAHHIVLETGGRIAARRRRRPMYRTSAGLKAEDLEILNLLIPGRSGGELLRLPHGIKSMTRRARRDPDLYDLYHWSERREG